MSFPNRRRSHFNAIDFGNTSVFASRFPVDLRDKNIRKIVQRTIPAYLDTIFLLHPSLEDFSTAPKKGRIPLMPTMTEVAIEKLEGDEKRKARGRQATLRALTDGALLSTVDGQITRENGAVRDFSIVAASAQNGDRAWYELRGVLNNEDEADDVREIAKSTESGEEWSIEADEDITRDFLRGIREQKSGTVPVEDLPIELSLMQLLDSSPQLYHQQATHESDQSTPGTHFTAERSNVISQGITRTVGYTAILKHVDLIGDIELNGSFVLSYDASTNPRYTAEMNYLIRALGETPSHEDRLAYFDQLSTYYRQNPDRVFMGLAQAAKELATLS